METPSSCSSRGRATGRGIERGSGPGAVQAAVGDALDFHTWRSLDREGLSVDKVAALMTTLVAEVAAGSGPK